MNKLSGGVLVLAMVAAVGADCCDPDHDMYTENQKAVQLCRDHGGIPTVERIHDQGGHTFMTLKRCDFPPTIPRVER